MTVHPAVIRRDRNVCEVGQTTARLVWLSDAHLCLQLAREAHEDERRRSLERRAYGLGHAVVAGSLAVDRDELVAHFDAGALRSPILPERRDLDAPVTSPSEAQDVVYRSLAFPVVREPPDGTGQPLPCHPLVLLPVHHGRRRSRPRGALRRQRGTSARRVPSGPRRRHPRQVPVLLARVSLAQAHVRPANQGNVRRVRRRSWPGLLVLGDAGARAFALAVDLRTSPGVLPEAVVALTARQWSLGAAAGVASARRVLAALG
mmetsp:Transcript_73973/g.233639  ORF Transcript_73973/g.233639 Transcript_73973/m.233639 type:complete len:261 (-) Transcript_73973:759-1541(-)